MAANRCPHCDIILTRSEAQSGCCPTCNKSFGRQIADLPAFPGAERTMVTDPERRPLGWFALFGILFVAGCVGAVIQGALQDFRGGGSYSPGIGMAMALTYGILHGMGLVKKKK